jgi:hypothetical protein
LGIAAGRHEWELQAEHVPQPISTTVFSLTFTLLVMPTICTISFMHQAHSHIACTRLSQFNAMLTLTFNLLHTVHFGEQCGQQA